MAFDIPNIAAPTAQGDFIESWRSQNMLKKEMLEAKMKQMENQYYPRKTESEIASKEAYAKFVEPQIRAKLSQDPNFWAGLTSEQREKFTQDTQKSLFNQNNAMAEMPKMPQSPFQRLMGAITGNANQQNQMNQSPTQIQQQNQVGMGSSNNPEEAAEDRVARRNSPLPNRQAELDYAYNRIPGKKSLNPAIETQRQLIEAKEGAKAEQKSLVREWQDKTKELGHSSKAAHDFGELIKSFNANYSKLEKYQKGSVYGRLPGMTDTAQKIDKVTALAEQTLASANQHGQRFTNMDLLSAQRGIPRRNLEPGAAKSISNQLGAMQERIKEQVPFYQRAKKLGLSTGEADQAWLEYIETHPLFNHETDDLIPRKGNEYIKFLSPERLDDIRSGITPEKETPKGFVSQKEIIKPNKVQRKQIINGKTYGFDGEGWFPL